MSTTNPDHYRQALTDPAAKVWLFSDNAPLDAQAFTLLDYSVNGTPQPITKTDHPDGRAYQATPSSNAANSGQDYLVSYSYSTLIEPRGHAMWIDIDKPTNGVSVELTHTGTGIERITPLDFLTTTPRIHRSERGSAAPISISADGWIQPKSGVVFIWTLTSELNELPQT